MKPMRVKEGVETMNAKEAIRILGKMYKAQPINERLSIENAALSTAISALEKVSVLEAENARLREKETPKKPIMKEGNNRDLFCSICGARVSDVADRIINSDNLQKYCGVCGQLLDWSSDKEC